MNVRALPFWGILTTASLLLLAPLRGQDLHYAELLHEVEGVSLIKSFQKPDAIESLNSYQGYGYEYLQRLVDGKGELIDSNWGGTHTNLQGYMSRHPGDIRLARRQSRSRRYEWIEAALIFNPKAADGGSNSLPRLEKISLPKVNEREAESMPGTLQLELSLGLEGQVLGSKVLEAPAAITPEISRRATDAVKRWVFKPARKGGVAVEATVVVPVCFAIDHNDESGFRKADKHVLPLQGNKPPAYPAAWAKAGIKATVTLEFVVDVNGQVSSAKVVTTNHPGFIDSALEAVFGWKYKPASRNGKPIRANVMQ